MPVSYTHLDVYKRQSYEHRFYIRYKTISIHIILWNRKPHPAKKVLKQTANRSNEVSEVDNWEYDHTKSVLVGISC